MGKAVRDCRPPSPVATWCWWPARTSARESERWAARVAADAPCPSAVSRKVRHGDRAAAISRDGEDLIWVKYLAARSPS
ncbi:hypothetical protein GM676_01960 [Duganella radicis]|uniref:Uncharacterized protein n=1 Tax=Duganella radicis TaxID=551988 RepID=A0A6L6PB88_9BURK|nr:hypothetical protein [Duganella radicis]